VQGGYAVTGPPLRAGLALSAAPDIGQLGTLDFDTGAFMPIITGLGSPRGLATLPENEMKARHGEHNEGHDEGHIAADIRDDDLTAVVAASRLTSAAQIDRGGGASLPAAAGDHRAEFSILYQRIRPQAKGDAISGEERSGHIKAKVATQRAFAGLATGLDDY
jgi:hypothetical protein